MRNPVLCEAQISCAIMRLAIFFSCPIWFASDQEQVISLTGLSALSIVLWKPNVIVSPLALDFEREGNRKVISM